MTAPIVRLNATLEARYRIERELGEGGMATVYLADDLRHERKVALKVLKPDLAAIVGAERFLAEIKTTANLQHPHILPLHDSGEADGFLFYVMPYVEGESLRQKLDREHQLPVDEAVRIATNVAEALDYAHRRGVIHRDIKPANILLLDGKPVVSDFGIALALGTAGGGRLTETGLSLGTPHYMSPEQATGDMSLGSATDVYALGCVLYEMLVGEPPYTGSTPQAVLGKILTGEPRSVTGERSTVPAHVEAVIGRALEKVPADRFSTAGEMVRALENAGFRWGGASDAATLATQRWNVRSIVLGIVIGISILSTWSVLRHAPSEAVRARHSSLILPGWFDRSVQQGLAVTSDGEGVVFVSGESGGREIWIRDLSADATAPIEGSQGAGSLFLSPDGEWVAFHASGELRRVPIGGGQPESIVSLAERTFLGGTWGEDDTIVYALPSGLWRVEASGGVPESLTQPGLGVAEHRQPTFLPDRSGVVLTITDNNYPFDGEQTIAVLKFGGKLVVLTDGHSPTVTPLGVVVFSRGSDGELWAASLHDDGTSLVADPVRVRGSGPWSTDQLARYALSSDGSLLYVPPPVPEVRQDALVWADRDGNTELIVEGADLPGEILTAARLSPDGTQIAFRAMRPGTRDFQLFVRDLRSRANIRIPVNADADWPVWTPDGQRLVFNRWESGDQDMYVTRADGTGTPEPFLPPDPYQRHAQEFSQDGRVLVFQHRRFPGARDSDIWAVEVNPPVEPFPVVATDAFEIHPSLSPDGGYMAFRSNVTGAHQIHVTDFPNAVRRWPISTTSGSYSPVWSASGDELFYRRGGDHAVMVVDVTTQPEFRAGTPRVLFEGDFGRGNAWGRDYDPTADAQRFVMVRRIAVPDLVARIDMVQGWLQDVERRIGIR